MGQAESSNQRATRSDDLRRAIEEGLLAVWTHKRLGSLLYPSREELLALCDSLAEAISADFLPESRPAPVPALRPFPGFVRSEYLRRLVAERQRVRDSAEKCRLFGLIRRTWQEELDAHGVRESEDHARWSVAVVASVLEATAWREREQVRELRVRELRRAAGSLRAAIDETLPAPGVAHGGHYRWRLLGSGGCELSALAEHYRTLATGKPGPQYVVSRLEQLIGLGPLYCYVGVEEFEGYAAFGFNGLETAVLERPVDGAPVYVVPHGWPELSRLGKAELLGGGPGLVRRLARVGDWFAKLQGFLDASPSWP